MANRNNKILLLSQNYPPPFRGGSYVYLYNLVENCSHKIDILTSVIPKGEKKIPFKNDRITRSRWLIPSTKPTRFELFKSYIYLSFFFIKKALKKEYSLLVIQTGTFGNSLLVLLAKLFQIPVIGLLTGEELAIPLNSPGVKNGIKRRLAKWSYPYFDGVIANSYYTKRILESVGISPDKIKVIWPTAHPDKTLSNKEKQKRGNSVLSVGRLVKRKGFHYLIEAIKLVKIEIPDVHLNIVGKGPEEDRLQRKIKENGLEDTITLKTNCFDRELSQLYKDSDLFVLLNIQMENGDNEGFGIVFIEAGAHYLPVIGGKEGGVSEAVKDQETGFLVDPKNVQQTANKILEILNNPELAEKMGESGWWKAKKEHDPVQNGIEFSQYLDKFIKTKNTCPSKR